ncbi:MAG: hypothetical protein IKY67_08495 [Paludibacteraceae bacterium]|nr:hypothetical protein [Paludibacteraceae bacterium]MBR5824164.1 hypothetical protein [Paludibacteraceae bacterium]
MSKKDSVDVNTVESQVVELLERYRKLKDENAALKQNLEKTTDDLNASKLEVAELKANYERLKLAKAYGWSEKSKRDAYNRITKLVRDIDKCLDLLNEID